MSFWDHIKPTLASPVATRGGVVPPTACSFSLEWNDGARTRLSAKTLRGSCPCAVCVDEWTNQRRHDPDKTANTTTLQAVQPVGNYAFNLAFSDSHSTGIFTWQHLRELSEQHPATPAGDSGPGGRSSEVMLVSHLHRTAAGRTRTERATRCDDTAYSAGSPR